MVGLLDFFGAEGGTPQAMQAQGLFGGLSALGAALAQAGQYRPAGQPGPGMADAFSAFGRGRQGALAGAWQQGQMDRQMKRQGLLSDAQGDKPDEALSPQALAMRRTLGALPEGVRTFADADTLPGLVIDREKGRTRPMTPAELAAAGFRPGTVAFTSDWTGATQVGQQPDTMTPEAMAQKLAIQRAGMQPQVRWTTIMGEDGKPIAQQSSLGEYRPLRQPSEGFTLGPGQQRFGPDGRPIAAGGPEKPNLPPGMQMVDGVAVPIPGVREAEDPKRAATAANDLRGEYTKLTADFRTVQDAFNKIEMAGKTGQGDMALLYGYMKILDPTSVVRESEFATAAKSGSFGEQMQGMVTKVLNGERLPETVREGFRAEARNVYQAQVKSYLNTSEIYRGLAARGGAKPEDVVLPFQFNAGGAAGGGGGGGGRDPLGILK